jgi:hypothetical protein
LLYFVHLGHKPTMNKKVVGMRFRAPLITQGVREPQTLGSIF